jgi:hypothetical protein
MAMKNWKWYGHAGHFIGAHNCLFHLCTEIEDVLVSTVDAYYPDRHYAEMQEIGWQRKYETMAFRIDKDQRCKCGLCCGLPTLEGMEIEMDGYNTAADAIAGHMAMCHKYDYDEEVS